MSVAKAALAYFGAVFAVGFFLGIVRTLWLAPALGERSAELVELPIMVALSLLAARLVVNSMALPSLGRRLRVGGVALLLLVGCEVGVVIFLRQQSLAEYVAGRDPVAGGVYLAALAVFAAAPGMFGRRRQNAPNAEEPRDA